MPATFSCWRTAAWASSTSASSAASRRVCGPLSAISGEQLKDLKVAQVLLLVLFVRKQMSRQTAAVDTLNGFSFFLSRAVIVCFRACSCSLEPRRSNGFITNDYRLMASSLVKMGAADGEVDINAFAFDIEKVMDSLGSMEAQLDTSAVIDEDTGRVSYGTSVNVDQEVSMWKKSKREPAIAFSGDASEG